MKKICSLLIVAAFAFSVSAQTTPAAKDVKAKQEMKKEEKKEAKTEKKDEKTAAKPVAKAKPAVKKTEAKPAETK